MMTELEDKLKLALTSVDAAKLIIERELEKDNNPKKQLYLKDYKIELFDLQLRLKDMLRNLGIIESR